VVIPGYPEYMMVLLKTVHREAFARHSPGRLLDYIMFRHLFSESRLKRVEYYTNASPEDMRWATFSRPIVHVVCRCPKALCGDQGISVTRGSTACR
jgi:hypothetical protein